jgi:hypothetical protein
MNVASEFRPGKVTLVNFVGLTTARTTKGRVRKKLARAHCGNGGGNPLLFGPWPPTFQGLVFINAVIAVTGVTMVIGVYRIPVLVPPIGDEDTRSRQVVDLELGDSFQ